MKMMKQRKKMSFRRLFLSLIGMISWGSILSAQQFGGVFEWTYTCSLQEVISGQAEARDSHVEFVSAYRFTYQPREVRITRSYRFHGENKVEEQETIPGNGPPNMLISNLRRVLVDSDFIDLEGRPIDRLRLLGEREYRQQGTPHTVHYYDQNRVKGDGSILRYLCAQDMSSRNFP